MKAFVANPTRRRKAKKKAQQRRQKRNPLPLVVMNPFRRRNKTMASKSKKKAAAGQRSRSRSRKNPTSYRRRRHSRNPLPATGMAALKLVGGASAGLLANVYIPGYLLGLLNMADSGIPAYVAALLAALVPAWLLEKHPEIAKGWLAGGGAGLVWRIVDDFTGNKFLQITQGGGMGSFIVNGKPYVLPAQSVFGAYARGGGPAMLPATSGPAVAAGASTLGVAANAKSGLGWVYAN